MDTTNDFFVGLQGDDVVILRQPAGPISKEKALRLAAYLVMLVGTKEEFSDVLKAIQNT